MAEQIQISGTKVMVIGLEYPQDAEYPNIRFNSELMGGRLYAASVIDLFEYLQEEKKPEISALPTERFKKDYSTDGWPILDTKNQKHLGTDEVIQLLNQSHAGHHFNSVTNWKSTSADDLKSSLNCQVNNDPYGTAWACIYALEHGDVKAKTHRKHIAAALRAASKKLEEVPHD